MKKLFRNPAEFLRLVSFAVVLLVALPVFSRQDEEESRRQRLIIGSGCSCTTAPVVTSTSGSISHGAALTINGCCFGTNDVTEIIWDNLEDGAANTTATVGTWESLQNLTINSTAGEQRSSRSTYNVDYDFGCCSAAFTGGANQISRWYVSYWFKLDASWVWASSGHLSNVKIFRIWNSGATLDNVILSLQKLNGSALYHADPCMDGVFFWSGFDADIPKGSWNHFQFEYAENSATDATDGELRMWLNGTQRLNVTNLETRCTGTSTSKRVSLLGFFNSTGSSPLYTFWMDDAYVDNSWSRVELCNNSSYASCTHSEVQLPTAWNGTSVTITQNLGSFGAGSAYLFIVDQNGAKNATGFAVTVP